LDDSAALMSGMEVIGVEQIRSWMNEVSLCLLCRPRGES
jgi:hypothetical protein